MNINTKTCFCDKKLGFEGVLGVEIFDITLKDMHNTVTKVLCRSLRGLQHDFHFP